MGLSVGGVKQVARSGRAFPWSQDGGVRALRTTVFSGALLGAKFDPHFPPGPQLALWGLWLLVTDSQFAHSREHAAAVHRPEGPILLTLEGVVPGSDRGRNSGQRPGTSPDLSTPPWRKACLGPNKEGLSWPVPSEDTLYGLVTQHQWNFINSQPMSLFPTSGCDRGGEITWGK